LLQCSKKTYFSSHSLLRNIPVIMHDHDLYKQRNALLSTIFTINYDHQK